ncbi:response regulator receiver protein [Caballeronia arationis]|uniref:response regulator n=1 Tax=Caballeronia arationis TaxID=1777142 RepID=UPI00074C2CBE|nr:response regulator [Caballeronia arationis]SAK89888.1 response regulator receiver protein [Caballeronia arationis]
MATPEKFCKNFKLNLLRRNRQSYGTTVADPKENHSFSNMQHDSLPVSGLWSSRAFQSVTPPIAVLIVDDDRAVAEALSAALAFEGFRPAVVDGGYSAFLTPPALTPHIVILDIEMPLCNGFAVAAAMRDSGRFSATPIIAYSSLAEAEVMERGKEAQIDAFCRKGNSMRCLLALIDHLAPVQAAGI